MAPRPASFLPSAFTVALTLAGLAGLAGPAAAQDASLYRQGLPAVLSPASPANSGAAFSEAYRRRGQPRIMVFWMRALSERPASERVRVEHTEESVVVGTLGAGGALVRGGYGAGAVETYSAGVAAGQRSRWHGEMEGFVSEGGSDPLAHSVSREAESAFMQTLAGAGVLVVDRATATRLSAASSNDPRVAETAALASKADYLIEVTGVADPLAAGRPSYRVDIRSLKDGMIVASFSTDAEPRVGTDTAFVAVPGRGYVEKPGPAIGQELALQAMERMAQAWRR